MSSALTGAEANAIHHVEGLISLAVPSAFNYKAVDFVWRYVVKPGSTGPKIPYLKKSSLTWGTASAAKADGIVAAVQVTAYQNIQRHFDKTHAFFETACEIWAKDMKTPVYVLVWVVKRSSLKKSHTSGFIKVFGRNVFQLFLSFTDVGLGEFDC